MDDGKSGLGPIHKMEIAQAFGELSLQEQLYAHHLAKAAWLGTRIILRQVSPESNPIFDLIMQLYEICEKRFQGQWHGFADACKVPQAEMDAYLRYAATFLSNVGNFFGSGDQKFCPSMEIDSLKAITNTSEPARILFEKLKKPMFSPQPSSLGYPGDKTQSCYYPGDEWLCSNEITKVSQFLEDRGILPENTRIQKVIKGDKTIYQVHQASVEKDAGNGGIEVPGLAGSILLVKGDHSEELSAICKSLAEAAQHAANLRQRQFIEQYQQSFRSGDLEPYKASQITWIKDTNPSVETILGFVEPYRDPFGTRAEFEGIVAISNREETKLLTRLVQESSKFIRRLPWAHDTSENDGKGPFEKDIFDPPEFTSIHALAYCSSIIFPGINLPNYNDIRQKHGFKNVIIANRMSAEGNQTQISPFVDPSEALNFQKHKYPAYYIWVVLHELFGHGTGRLMTEEDEGHNFDADYPPVNPLDQQPITSWYRPGQTWTGVFGDLATTVDECRAELVGAYLMDDLELLALFGYTSESEITAQDLTYNMYVQLGVDGLRGLQNYNIDSRKWGQAHSRAHFAMMKCLLAEGNGAVSIHCKSSENRITVHVDRSRIISNGKPALGRMLLRLTYVSLHRRCRKLSSLL